MKKTFLSIVVVGVSALYIFSRSSAAPTALAGSRQVPVPAPATAPVQSAPPPAQSASAPPTPSPAPAPAQPAGEYKDGTYTGPVVDAYYGYVQVRATVSGGAITDVTFLQYPTGHATSRYINSQAMPYLKQEALSVQNANVNIISGATDTSLAFRQSLATALAQAKNS